MLICEYCGEAKEDVEECIEPYEKEINNITIEIVACDDCYAKLPYAI